MVIFHSYVNVYQRVHQQRLVKYFSEATLGCGGAKGALAPRPTGALATALGMGSDCAVHGTLLHAYGNLSAGYCGICVL